MEKKTEVALKRYLAIGGHGRWTESHFSWNGHVCATDGRGALAIPEPSDAPDGHKDGVHLVFRDSDKLDKPIMFKVADIEDALKKWPEMLPNSNVKVKDPQANEHLIGLEVGDELVAFRMVEMKRLCQTAKTLKCSVWTLTHASAAAATPEAGNHGYSRGLLGNAIVVTMPCVCTDDTLPHRISPYETTDQYIEGWRVIMEGGVLVGYKSTNTGINRVVSTTVNPDEFRRQVTKPKKKKVPPPADTQISLLDLIDQARN